MGTVGVGFTDVGSLVPKRRAGPDSNPVGLSPDEGFLFSRIDGATPWKLLREMGGLPPEEVDLCLESWLAQGLIECTEPPAESTRAWPRIDSTQAGGAWGIDPGDLDESLDLDLETQRRILELEQRLSAPPHGVLGIAEDADERTIKRAYRALSREFHPDRYFRRQIGSYEKRLHRVFKGVVRAYRHLVSPLVEEQLSGQRLSSPFDASEEAR